MFPVYPTRPKRPLGEVLAALHRDFTWPTRLPATQMLTDLLAQPDTMDACPKQAKQAVKEYLAQIKARRAVERQAGEVKTGVFTSSG